MLDGREVSDTERLFLASWKATRKARRKALHQHKVQQGLQSSAHYVLSSDPPPPMTMPALPARSPLRQWRKIHQQMRGGAGQHISLPTIVHLQQPSAFAECSPHHLQQVPVVAHSLQDARHTDTNDIGHGSLPVLPKILQSIT
ncbi:hypothetical protein GBAR_LOCUS15856 [Geodia barretti]|nr:hypothetical protein GBAR_LOCUS15856 [Geodia barretti]